MDLWIGLATVILSTTGGWLAGRRKSRAEARRIEAEAAGIETGNLRQTVDLLERLATDALNRRVECENQREADRRKFQDLTDLFEALRVGFLQQREVLRRHNLLNGSEDTELVRRLSQPVPVWR